MIVRFFFCRETRVPVFSSFFFSCCCTSEGIRTQSSCIALFFSLPSTPKRGTIKILTEIERMLYAIRIDSKWRIFRFSYQATFPVLHPSHSWAVSLRMRVRVCYRILSYSSSGDEGFPYGGVGHSGALQDAFSTKRGRTGEQLVFTALKRSSGRFYCSRKKKRK